MTMDISRLGIEVKSDGIDTATAALKGLGSAADSTEKKVSKLTQTVEKLLQSNLTSTMQAWTGAMSGVNTAMGSLATSVQSTVSAINAQINALNMLTPAIGRATSAQNGHTASGGVFVNTLKAMTAAALGYTGINFVMSIVHMADKWTDLNVKMLAATGSQNNATVAMRESYEIAQRLGTPLEGTVKLYSRLAPALAQVGFASKDVKDVVIGLSSAFHLGGATTGEMNQAILNFSHAMSGGHLNLRAFNALTAEAPLILRALAKQMTGGNMDALRQLTSAHKVGAKEIVEAIHSVQPEWDKLIANRPVTVEMALTRIKNTWLKTIGEMAQENHFNSALADGLSQVEKMIPRFVAGLGEAFGAMLQWVAQNKDKLAEIWTQIQGIVRDSLKFAESIGSWVGAIAGAGSEFSLVAEIIFSIRLAFAALQDALVIIKNSFVDIGAAIVDFFFTPLEWVLEAIGKAVGGFGNLVSLAATGARALGKNDLAKSLDDTANSAKDMGTRIHDMGTNASDSFKAVQEGAKKSTADILAGKGAVGALMDDLDMAAEKQAKLKYDENFNKHPTTAPDPKAVALAERLTKEFERQKESLTVQIDQGIALNKELDTYGQEWEKIGPMQKQLIKYEDDLALKKKNNAGALAITRAQTLLDLANIAAMEERIADITKKNLASDKDVLTGLDTQIKTEMDKLNTLNDKVAAIGGMKGDKKDNQVSHAQNQLDMAQGGFTGLSPDATAADIQKVIDKDTELLDIAKRAAVAQKILDQAAVTTAWDKLFDPKKAQKFGDTLTKAFGESGKALKTLIVGLQTYAVAQEKMTAAQELIDKTTDPAQKLARQQELAQENAMVQIKMYGDMAEAAQGFFKKGTDGYKAMGVVEKAFRLAEIAMAVENFAVKSGLISAETGLAIAGYIKSALASQESAAVQVASALGLGPVLAALGVATQAQGDPYTAWARMAAMAAAMAALGFAVSGHGGGSSHTAADRQAAQGTGTVLGDATKQSESIANSISELSKNSDIALQYSAGMLQSLKNIESALTGVTNSILLSNGSVTGSNFMGSKTGFSSTQAGGFGYGVANPLANVALGVTQVLDKATGGLLSKLAGVSTKSSLADSGITSGNQSIGGILSGGFKGSSYQDVQTTAKALFGLVSKSSTSHNTTALDASTTDAFTSVIKQMVSTVTLAATGLGMSTADIAAKLNAVQVSLGNISLKGLTGDQIQKQLEAVFSAFGDKLVQAGLGDSVTKFQQSGEGLLQTAVRVATGVESANFELGKLGLTAIKFGDIINTSGDVATEIVRQTIMLKEGAGGINNIISTMAGAAADLVSTYQSLLTVRLNLKQLGIASDVSADLINAAGGLQTLQTALNAYSKDFFTTAQQSAMATQALQQQFAALGLTMPNSKAAFVDLVNQLSASGVSGQDLAVKVIDLADAFNSLSSAADDNLSTLQGNLNNAYTAQAQTLTTLKTAMQGFSDSLGTFKTTLMTGDLSTGNAVDKYNTLKAQYEDVAGKAQGGDQTALSSFQQVAQDFLKASRDVNASGDAYTADFQGVLSMTQTLQDSTTKQASVADEQLTALQQQVNGLITINTSVETVTQAIEALQAAITAGVGGSAAPIAGGTPGAAVLPVNNSGTASVANASVNSTAALTAQISSLQAEVAGLRADAAAHAAMVATAVVSSSESNAETVVSGTASSNKQAAYAARSGVMLA